MNLPRVDFGFGMLDGIAQALGSLPGVTTLQVNTRQCDMRGQQSRMPTQGLPIEFTASCHIHIARTGNWRQSRIFRAHLRSQSQRIQPHVLWIVVTEVSDGVVEVLGRVRHITAKQFGPQNAKSRHKGAIRVIYRVSVSDRTGRWRRGWDSNPRYGITVNRISNPAHSTTLPPLQSGARMIRGGGGRDNLGRPITTWRLPSTMNDLARLAARRFPSRGSRRRPPRGGQDSPACAGRVSSRPRRAV